MIAFRLLATFSFPFLLAGCFAAYEARPPCAPPGAIQTSDNCTYRLDITSVNGKYLATVSKSVVVDNAKNSDWFGFLGFVRFFSQDPENYPYWQFPVEIEGAALVGAEQEFHGVRGKTSLTLGEAPNVAKAGHPCGPPGHVATEQCTYRLTVTKLDPNNDLVTATVSQSVVEENAKIFPHLAAARYQFYEYTFHVRDLGKQSLRKGSDYNFVSVRNSDYLELQP